MRCAIAALAATSLFVIALRKRARRAVGSMLLAAVDEARDAKQRVVIDEIARRSFRESPMSIHERARTDRGYGKGDGA